MKHAIRTRDEDATAPMDDLVAGLAKAKRGPWLTRTTGALLALVLVCGGFLAGIQVQQRFGTAATGAAAAGIGNRGAGAGGFRGGTGFTGGQQGGFTGGQQGGQTGQAGQQPAAAPISGKIKLVDGTTVYIETADGQVLTVKTGDTTTVQSTKKINLKDLAAGTEITVQGTTQDSTITATTITAAK